MFFCQGLYYAFENKPKHGKPPVLQPLEEKLAPNKADYLPEIPKAAEPMWNDVGSILPRLFFNILGIFLPKISPILFLEKSLKH